MTNDSWFEIVDAQSPIVQGELVFGCPILFWKSGVEAQDWDSLNKEQFVAAHADIKIADVIVVSQACQLGNGKVTEVLVCAHYELSDFRETWTELRAELHKEHNSKAWESFRDDVRANRIPHKWAMKSDEDLGLNNRIVDFYTLHVIPLQFLALIAERPENAPRKALKGPYRDQLAQNFGLYFSRIGLPNPIKKFK